nr:hypothetical protein [Tanacetum cinerariifolium]
MAYPPFVSLMLEHLLADEDTQESKKGITPFVLNLDSDSDTEVHDFNLDDEEEIAIIEEEMVDAEPFTPRPWILDAADDLIHPAHDLAFEDPEPPRIYICHD